MATVTLKDVTKEFKTRRECVLAVDGVTLAVNHGESVVLLGPSGCGKTTTLRLIAGLEQPTRGSIDIGGKYVNDTSPRDRDVALVFQHYALYPHLSVKENLGFGLRMRNLAKPEIKSRVSAVAGRLKITELLNRRPHELSGGQQQRVALGRAIVRRPNAFLLDEPLANLDARLRAEMRLEMRQLQRDLNMTQIYVTHDQHEAMMLADRLAVMRDGRIEQFDRAQVVFDCPLNRYVAGIVGSSPLNLIAGNLERSSHGVEFVVSSCRIPMPSRCVGMHGGVGRVELGFRADRCVVFDVRPESPAFQVSVELILPLGDRQEIHGRFSDGQEVVGRVVPTANFSEGASAWIVPDGEGLWLFDQDGGGRNIATFESDAA